MIVLVAFGCSFLLKREEGWEEFVRGLALFLGGMICGILAFHKALP